MLNEDVRVFIMFMEGRAINALFDYMKIWGIQPDFQFVIPTINLNYSEYLEYALVVEENVEPLHELDEIVFKETINTTEVGLHSYRLHFI